jgi:hypothetical protein
MAFNWNFKRQPDLTNYIGAQIDPYNASRIASENMQGYRPNAAFTPGTPAEQAAAAMQGYTQNPQGGQFSVPNDMHGGMGQPDLEGYGESLQAASDAAAQAQAKEQQIADIESQISALEKRIAENTAKLKNWNNDDIVNKVAALEARKINSQDPTSIWRWKVDREEARRIAKEEKDKTKQLTAANALIEATNTIENMVVDPSMDTPTKNAMLSKLADIKSNLQKNGLPTKMVDDKMSEIKGETETSKTKGLEGTEYEGTSREQWDNEAEELLKKPNLTQGDIMKFKQKNPNISNEVRQKLEAKHSELIESDKKKAYEKKFETYIADYAKKFGNPSERMKKTLRRNFDKLNKKG